jgi:hypothetical protein
LQCGGGSGCGDYGGHFDFAGAGVAFEAFEVGTEFGGALAANVAIFFEGFFDYALEVGRKIRVQTNRRHRGFVKDGVEHRGRCVTGKRQEAGGHFVENHAEGKEVSARIHFLAEGLFGRHVGHGPHRGAGAGEMRLRGGLRFSCAGWVGGIELGEAEIENLCVASAGHENIGGLDVAVNDVLGMSRIQRIGNIDGDGKKHLQLEGMGGDELLERVAVEIFHGNEGAAQVLADFVNSADVGMIQGG